MNLSNLIKKNKFDYNRVRAISKVRLSTIDGLKNRVNVVIPYKDRWDNLTVLIKYLQDCRKLCKYSVDITVVEHDIKPTLDNLLDETVNYIWIPMFEDNGVYSSKFNKCLCFNMGILFTREAEWYLCHDVDCVSSIDLFDKLFENVEKQRVECLQAFADRRVYNLTQQVTEMVYKNYQLIYRLMPNLQGIRGTIPGAKGGSIFISREAFFKIGGFDPEFFYEYAPEDMFFWEKMEVYYKVGLADSPKIYMYHLNHPSKHLPVCMIKNMHNILDAFRRLSKGDKERIIEEKRFTNIS